MSKPPVRHTRQVETRLLAEYLKERVLPHPFIQKVPLGGIDEELIAKEGTRRAIGFSRPFRPEVDAVVIYDSVIEVIEAKIFKIVDGIAKLPLYASLVPTTPELARYMPRKVGMRLVVPWCSDLVWQMAENMSVVVEIFCPGWVKDEVERYHRYWTADYKRERDEKRKLREYFGVE
jgi:hypothetical protein